MGAEEQQEEREVLDSIFPEEITDISETEFRITIALDVAAEDNGGAEEPPSLLLSVRYTSNYPDEAPDLDLLAPQNASAHSFFDLGNDRDDIMASLDSVIAENLGMAMIFTLAMSIKDTAETLIRTRAEEVRAERQREKDKAEELENEKFNGTMVTRERFLEWQSAFKAEMGAAEQRRVEEQAAEDKKKRITKEEAKMTGRQLWEGGHIGKLDDEDEEDQDALEATEDFQKVSIAA